MRFEIVIPTRNGARWLGQFLAAYRKLGVEPLYIVDARSDDRTEVLLRSAGARTALCCMEADFPEGGMIEFASHLVEHDWILRIDDDEFPSQRLLVWAEETGCRASVDCWSLSRLPLLRYEGGIKYGRLRSLHHSGKEFIDPQNRLYRHRRVEYCDELHSAGFKTHRMHFAPADAFLVHCEVLLKNAKERLEKLRRYEAGAPGSSWKFGYHSLPELFPRVDRRLAPLPNDEFDALLVSLPQPQAARVTLTEDERRTIRVAAKALARKDRRLKSLFANKKFSEFVCTSGKAIGFLDQWFPAQGIAQRLHQYGADLHWGAELREMQRSGDSRS
jgi:hypothetical protein